MLTAQSQSATTFAGYSYSVLNLNMQQAVAKATIEALASAAPDSDYDSYTSFLAEFGLEQMKTQGSVVAKFAMNTIQIFKNLMEVIFIAFLPIMLIMMLAPGGIKVVKNYVMSLIWIQLFNQIMAVLMFIINMSAVWQSRSHMEITETYGYSIANLSFLNDFTQTYIATAGYMMIAVPAIATAILYGGQWAASQMFSSIASSGHSAAAMASNPAAVQQAVNVAEIANPTRGLDVQRYAAGNSSNFLQQSMFGSETGLSMESNMKSLGGLPGFANSVGRSNMLNAVSSASAGSAETYGNIKEAAGEAAALMRTNASTAYSSGNAAAGDKFSKMADNFDKFAGMSDLDLAKNSGMQSGGASISGNIGRIAGGDGVSGSLKNTDVVAASNMDTDIYKATERQSETSSLNSSGTTPIYSGMFNAASTEAQVGAAVKNGLSDGSFTDNQTQKFDRAYATTAGENSEQTSAQAFENAAYRTISENAQTEGIKRLFNNKEDYETFKIKSAMYNGAVERGNIAGAMQVWKNMGNVERAAFAESQLTQATRDGRINSFTNPDGSMNLDAVRQIASKVATMEQADAYAWTKTFNGDPNAAMASYESQQFRKYLTEKETEAFKNQQGLSPELESKISAQSAAWNSVKTDAENKGLNYAYAKPVIGGSATKAMTMNNALSNVTDKFTAEWIRNRGIENVSSINALEAENRFRENSAYQNDIAAAGVAEGIGHARFGAQVRDGLAVNYFNGINNAGNDMQSIINVSAELRTVDSIPVAGRLLTDTVVTSSAAINNISGKVENFAENLLNKFSGGEGVQPPSGKTDKQPK